MTGLTRAGRAIVVLGLALVLLASCSNRSASINRRPQAGAGAASVVNGVQEVTVYVGDTYRFNPDVITVHPGTVRVTLVHQGTGAPHDLQVLGFPADFVPLVRGGAMSTATFTTPAPGTYKFVCTIHVAQGQTGTLVVLAS